jgi:Glyoxalase/Bleomycin resistance protein/Dioxygenase superfamily
LVGVLTSEPDLTARRHDAIGRIMQNGYVVHDWRNAAEHWGSVLGVGPFFSMQHVDFEWCEYRGQRVQIDMSVGIAYSGDFQIELVQHVGALTGNLSQTLQQSGLQEKIIQQGLTRAGVRFAYLDTVAFNGTMLELIETNPAMLKSFAYMQKAALQWDGKECIRG